MCTLIVQISNTTFIITAFSHAHSYRVCVRVYLNGDGIGGVTHLSVFLVLMHGEFDTLLQWPFRQQVTVTLQGELLHYACGELPNFNTHTTENPFLENVVVGCGV